MSNRYGIAEWYGEPYHQMDPGRRQTLASHASTRGVDTAPMCPFQRGTRCSKKGGVCSIRPYRALVDGSSHDRIGEPAGSPVIVCPKRFEQNSVLPTWLASIVGFDQVFLAREIPFMRSPTTQREAGRIDLVVAQGHAAASWYGLEIQAVYFSGRGMADEFELLRHDTGLLPPAPTAIRRPDWRSSSAKRLMPQLEIKAPTLRRWSTKLAVAVDMPFFEAIGGASEEPSHDLNEGDIVWLVPRINGDFVLERDHWEVLSLEASSEKLLAADTVKRDEFESVLRTKLQPLPD